MIQESNATQAGGVDFAQLLVGDRQEYAAMSLYADHEDFFGSEVVVPILYEPR
jgi:hypothetical protein